MQGAFSQPCATAAAACQVAFNTVGLHVGFLWESGLG